VNGSIREKGKTKERLSGKKKTLNFPMGRYGIASYHDSDTATNRKPLNSTVADFNLFPIIETIKILY
jgi:hypothetical protein